jgi:hypothetical protein
MSILCNISCYVEQQDSRFSSAQAMTLVSITQLLLPVEQNTNLTSVHICTGSSLMPLTPHGTSLPNTHGPVTHKSPKLEKQY